MRTWLLPTLVALLLATLTVKATEPTTDYDVQIQGVTPVERDGQLFVTVEFKIKALSGDDFVPEQGDQIVVEEDGQRVATVDIKGPGQPLTAVLALDTSGSMRENNKMPEAQAAARLFLDRLSPRANCGLVLFDHRLRVEQPPAPEPYDADAWKQHRDKLRDEIQGVEPAGGTAYFDATAHAIQMIRESKGRRAVVLMTDGVDLNSKVKLPEVIKEATEAHVPVYTVGVGEPGKNEPVTTILVLDCSGSMREKASTRDRKSKIEALREASAEFVELMRPGARTTLLPFSHEFRKPSPFTDNKAALKQQIGGLRSYGGTRLFDAVLLGIQELDLKAGPGKRAAVVLTDGEDNESRYSLDNVLELAREKQIALHTLGLGVPPELNEEPLQEMAKQTGGTYHHVTSSKELYDVFEDLSIQLHDDGIDEASLRKLAEETGGKYYRARDVKDLRLYYQELADKLQSTYTVTYPRRRASHDGTSSGIDISIWRNGARISNVAQEQYNRYGVVVPEMDARVYLLILAILGGLLVAPLGLRRLHRHSADV